MKEGLAYICQAHGYLAKNMTSCTRASLSLVHTQQHVCCACGVYVAGGGTAWVQHTCLPTEGAAAVAAGVGTEA